MRYVCPECGDGADGPGACPADRTERAPVGADMLLGTTIGSWRVARLLGAGGMGRVYVAVQPKIGARVAIKVLKRDSASDADVVERFFNEARAVNLIKHEAIVDVIDLGQLPDGAPYIVMEYLDGASLGAILRAGGALPLRLVARIVSEVLAALEAVHAKGIIHRDLKPDNVFVSPSGRVTVLDFGVAKLGGTDGIGGSTQTGSLLGTPAYMSPEQARSQPLDPRSDLYAVGVILYEAATRKLPFVAANLFDLLHKHVNEAPTPPRELVPEIPEALEAVILRALAKAPPARFASAKDMREALDASVQSLPELAVASLTLPREAALTKHAPSDPFAETAASDSISTDKTQAAPLAEQAKPKPAPADATTQRSGVHISKPALFALVGALLVAVGLVIAIKLGAGSRTPVRVVTIASHDAGLPGPVAALPDDLDAGSAIAVVPVAAPEVDAGAVAKTGTSVPSIAPIHAPSGGLPKDQGPFAVAHPDAFDPIAYYKLTAPRATAIGGKSTRMTVMRIHDMNRQGLVDLTSGALVEIIFASPERAKAGDDCYIEFDFLKGKGNFEIGHQAETDKCDGGVYPPRCTMHEIIARATAKGLPADVDKITLNKFPDFWQVSAPGLKFSEAIDDDCE